MALIRITTVPAPIDAAPAPFVLVGGVPGAGKSTALAQLALLHPDVEILDTDTERRRFDRLVPAVPYSVLRPLVHVIHFVRILARLLAGPSESRGLVVHDPSTRFLRLGLIGRLARSRGWDAQVVFVDISQEAALAGQHRRRRIVGRRRFEAHWRRWHGLRAALDSGVLTDPGLLTTEVPDAPADRWGWALGTWRTRILTCRETALEDICGAMNESHLRWTLRSDHGAKRPLKSGLLGISSRG